jgi:hypothetical protein
MSKKVMGKSQKMKLPFMGRNLFNRLAAPGASPIEKMPTNKLDTGFPC